MGSYRDSLREIAKKLEDLRDDFHEFARVLANIAEKVSELEEENKKTKIQFVVYFFRMFSTCKVSGL